MKQAGSPAAVWSAADESPLSMAATNPNVPNPARVYDALLGGKDNFAADREVADRLAAAKPAIRHNARANRAYLGRVVRHLAAEAGIRQFLDLGTGLPSLDNTHEVAQDVALGSRIVYVDNDPIVIAHARAMLVSSPEGATAYLSADIRDPDWILGQASKTLDLDRPVAIILLGVLYMIPDSERPYETVAEYLHAVAPGSYLAISHPASDIDAVSAARAARQYDRAFPTTQTNRSRAEVARFFNGLDLLEPGVVQLNKWRPDLGDVDLGVEISGWAGLGRKR
jgi:O-methyltransferase involved in polyketide biosynthesis